MTLSSIETDPCWMRATDCPTAVARPMRRTGLDELRRLYPDFPESAVRVELAKALYEWTDGDPVPFDRDPFDPAVQFDPIKEEGCPRKADF
jgi:hypothetical protein